MRDNKETIRWTLNVEGTKFSIFDIEGGNYNLSVLDNRGLVLGTYQSADEAASALPRFVDDIRVEHILKGKAIPQGLSAWTPESRTNKLD